MDELLKDFLTETNESLEVLDVEIVRLERNPNDPELLGNIFRLFHTVKGTCGFLGLSRLEAVAHAAENVLGKFRDGEIKVTGDAVTLILASLDCIKTLLAQLEATEAEPAGDDKNLIDRLNGFITASKAASAPAASEPAALPVKQATLYDRLGGMGVIDAAVELFYKRVMADPELKPFFQGVNMDVVQVQQVAFLAQAFGGPQGFDGPDQMEVHKEMAARGLNGAHFDAAALHLEAALKQMEVSEDMAAEIFALAANARAAVLGEAGRAVGDEVSLEGDKTKFDDTERPGAKAAIDKPEAAKQSAVSQQSIRVNVDQLESLMTLASEMVLTRNQLLQVLRTRKDSEFASPLQRLNQLTTELQEGVMKTRMQPIGNAWQKLPRIVRDLSRELDKKIDLQMSGADTELDRQVLELIKDPLTHMVRNSGDHGLETPAGRLAAGKPETGRISLSARHEGGHIVIEVGDDGRGLNTERIRAKAVSNGLVSQAEAETLTDRQVHQFIFHAGLSTAEKVTAVSGRGVGMDVVRSNIEKIGGVVDVASKEGVGSTFTIKIPLTLAIVSTLIVECAKERFAIPQLCVLELVCTSSASENTVEYIGGTPVLRLRERLLPLVSLRDLLKLEASTDAVNDGNFIVVTQVGNSNFGIMVDRVFDTEEIVVKPVAPVLRDIAMFSGNTILGDGGVVMILDANGMAAATGELAITKTETAVEKVVAADASDRIPLLLFRAGAGTAKAVPLSLVARLEEIEVGKIEWSDGKPVVQYRDQLMPLIPIDSEHAMRETGRQPVLVFTDGDKSIGLLVDEIVDIVEQRLTVELTARREGYLGTAVLDGHPTEIVDVGHYVGLAFQKWFAKSARPTDGAERNVLLVDDSPFFRNLLTPLLSAVGYSVTTATSGNEALELCAAGRTFDVIISDIEMPGMSGFELAETLKRDKRWRDVPLVALSGRTAEADLDRGRRAGFTDYVAKFDRDALLASLKDTLANLGDAA
ncbi:MAG: chemotaxis protein CheW [Alphaproteobacteria bacterium]